MEIISLSLPGKKRESIVMTEPPFTLIRAKLYGQIAANPFSRSAMISSMCSVPIDSLIVDCVIF